MNVYCNLDTKRIEQIRLMEYYYIRTKKSFILVISAIARIRSLKSTEEKLIK
jgi:hypothetical protein